MSINDYLENLLSDIIFEELQPYIEKNFISTFDVFPLEYNGNKIWVKQAKKTGSNFLHILIYKILKNNIFKPVKIQTPQDNIKYEANRIDTISKTFINVPKLLGYTNSYMVTLDSGQDIRSLLNYDIKDLESRQKLIYKALDTLILFHKKGFFHGGAQIKNFTYKDGEVYLIDFEEDFENIELKELQFRDIFLFLVSIARYNINLNDIVNYYNLQMDCNLTPYFMQLKKDINFAIKLLDNKWLLNKMDKDTKGVYKLLKNIGEKNC